MAKFLGELESLLETSELLNAVKKVKEWTGTGKPVSENAELQKQLEANGCWSPDWSRVFVADGFRPRHAHSAKFFGDVYLGAFGNEPLEANKGVRLSPGVYNCVIMDSVVGDDALVYNVGVLSNYMVGPKAVVMNCDTVSHEAGSAFGNGEELSIAIETGGREVLVFGELTIPMAAQVAGSRYNRTMLEEFADFVGRYVEAARCPKGIIGAEARVVDTSKVVNTFVGAHAIIDNAKKVCDSTLLSNAEEPAAVRDGAYVVKSIIQWGSDVSSMGICDSSLLCEHSHVERHGKVTQSILGPNTGVAEGEVTACLVGPFVGFHHQALLIAAFWPEGKGNVGYGANVGSNHTSKAPDQEIWPGEGIFFGLGVNIKFPSNFARAPYSIIATGVNALPQKVSFPFSLINTPAERIEGVSPAYNEIVPGWVLSDQIYMVRRNEGKYTKRNKARRTKFDFEVLRPEIVDMMVEARERLAAIKDTKKVYTDADIKGLGKNYMVERSRLQAIDVYSFYIQYYGLLGLKKQLEKVLATDGRVKVSSIISEATEDPRWEHERAVLQKEFAGKAIPELMRMLAMFQERIAKDVQISKEKDDNRGARIIPDYGHAHPQAIVDSFVKETWEVTRELRSDVDAILSRL